MEPKQHLRVLLRVLEHTHAFKDAFGELDEGLQGQIRGFMADEAGVREAEILGMGKHGGGGDFHVPPSPAVKHHFKEMVKETVREKAQVEKMKVVQRKVMKKIREAKEELQREMVEEVAGHIEMVQKVEDHVGEFWGRHAGHGHLGGLLKSVDPSSLSAKLASFPGKEMPRIWEDEKGTRMMEVHKSAPFHNWGNTVEHTPLYTFVPTTVLGLSNLVKWAKVEGYRVRCSGYRHSWSNTFSQEKQVLVSMLNLESVERIPDVMSITEQKGDVDLNGDGVVDVNELKSIELDPKIEGLSLTREEEGKMFCRVGAAVTNEQFRRWAVGHGKWALPVDVILVEYVSPTLFSVLDSSAEFANVKNLYQLKQSYSRWCQRSHLSRRRSSSQNRLRLRPSHRIHRRQRHPPHHHQTRPSPCRSRVFRPPRHCHPHHVSPLAHELCNPPPHQTRHCPCDPPALPLRRPHRAPQILDPHPIRRCPCRF